MLNKTFPLIKKKRQMLSQTQMKIEELIDIFKVLMMDRQKAQFEIPREELIMTTT